ncbi:MAG: hypothetical protein ABNH30_10645, partial [Thalassolituus sp.]
ANATTKSHGKLQRGVDDCHAMADSARELQWNVQSEKSKRRTMQRPLLSLPNSVACDWHKLPPCRGNTLLACSPFFLTGAKQQ